MALAMGNIFISDIPLLSPGDFPFRRLQFAYLLNVTYSTGTQYLPADLMQDIAREMHFSETPCISPQKSGNSA